MKKFILEKNFQTGMTIHPLSIPTPPTTAASSLANLSSQLSVTSSSLSVTTSSSPSNTNGCINNSHNSNVPPINKHRGVNSNQLIHSPNPISSIGNHNDSGFQPYRGPVPANSSSSLEDALLTNVQQQQQQSQHTQSSGRPSADNPGSSSSSSSAVNANIGNHILPYSERLRSAAVAAGYTYNPFIGPPSHTNQPASLPPSQASQPSHHSMAPHIPPQPPFRIDEPIYLERYGLMRSTPNNLHQSSNVQSINHSDLSNRHTSTNSNVPSYQMSSRYSELLATHQERVLNEEKQRLLGHGANTNHHSNHPHQHQSSNQHPSVSTSGPSNYKNFTSSTLSTSSDLGPRSREYTSNGNLMSGIPTSREAANMSSSNFSNKKLQPNGSVTIVNPGSRPLNLTSNATVMNHPNKNNATNAILIDIKKDHPPLGYQQHYPGPSANQTTITFTNSPATTTSSSTSVNNHLWRPQISERDDSRNYFSVNNHNHSRMFQDNVKRTNAFEVPIDYSSTKKQRFSDLPGDLSFKSSSTDHHPLEPFNAKNHASSSFFINSTPDQHSQILKSSPQISHISSLPSSSHLPQPLQPAHPSPPLKQLNLSSTQSKRSSTTEVPPSTNHLSSKVHLLPTNKDHTSSKPVQEAEEKIVSKLDLLEIKLKAKRKERTERAASRGSIESSDDDDLSFSEEESDEEENEYNKARYRLKYMVTKGLPLKLEKDPEKISYFQSLGLVTHSAKNEILFKKYVSQSRYLSNLDAKPFVLTNICEPEFFDYESIFLQPTDILPNNLLESETNLEEKFCYMNLLGLKHVLNVDEIRKREQIWEGVLEERDRRKSINLSYGKINNNLTKEALEKWLHYLATQPRVYNPDRYNNENGYLSNNNIYNKCTAASTSSLSFSTPPSHESSSTAAAPSTVTNTSWHNQRRTLSITYDRRQSKQSKNMLKQGLLKSLDNSKETSTQKCLKTKADKLTVEAKRTDDLQSIDNSDINVNDKHVSPSCPVSRSTETSDKSPSNTKAFKWPGIEAIIEAYEKYAVDTNQEKELLSKRLAELRSSIREKNATVEKLTKKLTNLTNLKRELDEEHESYEKRITSTKLNLNQIAQ